MRTATLLGMVADDRDYPRGDEPDSAAAARMSGSFHLPLERGRLPCRTVVRVLFVNTARSTTLFADTWVHVQIMRHLDRSTHEVHVACDPGRPGHPTPTFNAVRSIPDAHVIAADLGPELSRQSGLGKLAALAPDTAGGGHRGAALRAIRRRHIDVIHTSDRPRDAAVCMLLGRLTGRPSIIQSHVSLQHVDGPDAAVVAAPGRSPDRRLEFVGDSLVASGIPAQRVHVVPNAIDVDAWKPGRGRAQVREELAIPADAPVVLTVCRLFAEKGPPS